MIQRILINRLLQAVMVAWGVGSLSFVLMRSLPGDMAYRVSAGRYGQDNVSAEAAEWVRQELALDLPAWQAYLHWLLDMLRLDLGVSLISGAPVIDEIKHQLGHSIELAVMAILLAALMAFPLGILSGLRARGWLDRSLLLLSSLLRAQPVFVIGLMLILAFAVYWPLFPVAGFGQGNDWVLPAFSLALALAAVSSRVVRDSTLAVIHSPYYQFARVKGLSEWQTFRQHGLRNLSVPVVAFMGIQLVGLIEGIVMIESLFSWPGIGHGLAHAIFSRDVPMIQGTALMMGLLFVALNTLVDLACYKIDPRGRPE